MCKGLTLVTQSKLPKIYSSAPLFYLNHHVIHRNTFLTLNLAILLEIVRSASGRETKAEIVSHDQIVRVERSVIHVQQKKLALHSLPDKVNCQLTYIKVSILLQYTY